MRVKHFIVAVLGILGATLANNDQWAWSSTCWMIACVILMVAEVRS